MSQEAAAFLVVGVAALALGNRAFQKYGRKPLAGWLLRSGRVKWAMWLHPNRSKSLGNSCCD